MAKTAAEDAIKEYERMSLFKLSAVQYRTLENAA
jgi:hypothetical protein